MDRIVDRKTEIQPKTKSEAQAHTQELGYGRAKNKVKEAMCRLKDLRALNVMNIQIY